MNKPVLSNQGNLFNRIFFPLNSFWACSRRARRRRKRSITKGNQVNIPKPIADLVGRGVFLRVLLLRAHFVQISNNGDIKQLRELQLQLYEKLSFLSNLFGFFYTFLSNKLAFLLRKIKRIKALEVIHSEKRLTNK